MNLECSQCQNKELISQPIQFQLTKNQPRSAFGLTCTNCGHIEEVFKIKSPEKKQSAPNMRDNISIVDYNEMKARYDALTKKLSSINIKATELNASLDIKLKPIDRNKPTGIIDPKTQQQLDRKSQTVQYPATGTIPEEDPAFSPPATDQ